MKRVQEIRSAPRNWVVVLRAVYPFLTRRGIGDALLYGSQALSVYLNNPLRSKDLDLVSSQIGPKHLDALVEHLGRTEGFEVESSTIQSRPRPRGKLTIYSAELRLDGKPFILEIFDKVLDGQNPSILTPYTRHVHRWKLYLWVPSPDATVALRLSFRRPEGISRLNAERLSSFIRQNRRKLNFQEIRDMIRRWGMEELVRSNLETLHKTHRMTIPGERLLWRKES